MLEPGTQLLAFCACASYCKADPAHFTRCLTVDIMSRCEGAHVYIWRFTARRCGARKLGRAIPCVTDSRGSVTDSSDSFDSAGEGLDVWLGLGPEEVSTVPILP